MLPQSNEHPVLGIAVIRKVLRLLEPLKRNEGGASIYHYIEQTLSAVETQSRTADETYAGLLTLLLSTVARQLPVDSPLQVQIRLLEIRLSPPFTEDDLAEVRSFIETHLAEIGHAGEDNAALEGAIAPLLESFDIREGEKGLDAEPGGARPAEASRPAPTAEPEYMKPAAPERRVDVSYRRHLDEKRQGIQRIQQTLSQQVSTCIKNSKSFSTLLEQNLQVLQHSGAQEDIMTVRSELIGAVENLITEQAKVTQKLEEAKTFLGEIESDSQQLSDELTRIHLLSLTDDLTGLPNRRAFLRRLQDEVSRVQRYGNPLSLALIDLDGFKNVNDKLGHAAGDEVLRVVASEILSIFRHHDLVARYGGEEFAVLLPNTHVEGALRALRKVQKRAQESSFQYQGSTVPLPTFSAGLTLYRPGETPEAFIQRADHALYRAKRLGRNRIESDQLDATTAGVPSSMA